MLNHWKRIIFKWWKYAHVTYTKRCSSKEQQISHSFSILKNATNMERNIFSNIKSSTGTSKKKWKMQSFFSDRTTFQDFIQYIVEFKIYKATGVLSFQTGQFIYSWQGLCDCVLPLSDVLQERMLCTSWSTKIA